MALVKSWGSNYWCAKNFYKDFKYFENNTTAENQLIVAEKHQFETNELS